MRVFAILLSLAGAALSQSVSIGAPTAGQTLTAGTNTTVSVLKQNSLSASTEIGIAILVRHCSQSPCEDTSQRLGTLLYSGSYNPQFGSGGFFGQNFSVMIPGNFTKGSAVLSIAHAQLVGAGPSLATDIANVTVNVA